VRWLVNSRPRHSKAEKTPFEFSPIDSILSTSAYPNISGRLYLLWLAIWTLFCVCPIAPTIFGCSLLSALHVTCKAFTYFRRDIPFQRRISTYFSVSIIVSERERICGFKAHLSIPALLACCLPVWRSPSPPPGSKNQHQGCSRRKAQQSICRTRESSQFLVSQSQFI
jgi:hypothetical protein